MSVVSSLTVQIGANTSGLQQGINNAQRDMRGFLRNADGSAIGFGQALKGVNAELTKMGLGFLPAVGAMGAIGLAVKGSIGAAIEYEAAFANVRKTVDASEAELSNLSDTLRAMATGDSPVSALDNSLITLTEIAATAGQLGIATQNIAGFTEQMAVLGVATDLTANEAAVFAARFANVTKMDISKVNLMGDALVTLGNNMATTESEIAGFASRTAPLANFNWSPDEILGYSAALSALGVRAELGGTNLIKTVNEMTTAVALGGPKLAGFAEVAGMTAEQFKALAGEDSQAAFQKFITGLAGLDADQQIIQLNKLGITSVEQISLLQRMAGGLDTVTQGLDLAAEGWAGNDAAMTEAAAKADTSAGKIENLKNNLNELGVAVGQAVMPVIDVAVTVTAQAVKASADIFREAKTLGENLGRIIGHAIVTDIPTILNWNPITSNLPPDRVKDSLGKKLEDFFVNNVMVVGSPVRISLQNVEAMLAAADTLDKVASVVQTEVAGMKPIRTLVKTAFDLVAPGAAEMIPQFNTLIDEFNKVGPTGERALVHKIRMATPIEFIPGILEMKPTGKPWLDRILSGLAGQTEEAASTIVTSARVLVNAHVAMQSMVNPETGQPFGMPLPPMLTDPITADVDANITLYPTITNGEDVVTSIGSQAATIVRDAAPTEATSTLSLTALVGNGESLAAGVRDYLTGLNYDATASATLTVMTKLEYIYEDHPELRPPTMPDGTPMQRPVPGMGNVPPSHADGNSYIPFDGYVTELHKGERVLTASENMEYTFGGRGGGGQIVVHLTTFGNNEQEAVERFRRAFREGGL